MQTLVTKDTGKMSAAGVAGMDCGSNWSDHVKTHGVRLQQV
jgi:hypothetical protein